jgi:tetratricopeptide (TPR) repeat protein
VAAKAVAGAPATVENEMPAVPAWERWNDYGIGLLRKAARGSGELRQAEAAFRAVEALGRADGPLNLARVRYREGRLDDAADALRRAAAMAPPAPPWVLTWFSALIDKQNGALDAAAQKFRALAQTAFPEARARGFDFSRDTRLLNQLGQTLYEQARRERGPARQARRTALLREAVSWFERVLAIDPEDRSAHYNLARLYTHLRDPERAERHRQAHLRYKPDDDARARAVSLHRRRNPAADHAAEAVAIYDLRRTETLQ